jgi:hypothetical protein
MPLFWAFVSSQENFGGETVLSNMQGKPSVVLKGRCSSLPLAACDRDLSVEIKKHIFSYV